VKVVEAMLDQGLIWFSNPKWLIFR
jgi:hypothetical protein